MDQELKEALSRIAEALDRLAPLTPPPRDVIENERSTAISPSEAVEEKVLLSDRFGLWLGLRNADPETLFAMIKGYAEHDGLDVPVEALPTPTVEWPVRRGARWGRVA